MAGINIAVIANKCGKVLDKLSIGIHAKPGSAAEAECKVDKVRTAHHAVAARRFLLLSDFLLLFVHAGEISAAAGEDDQEVNVAALLCTEPHGLLNKYELCKSFLNVILVGCNALMTDKVEAM